MQKDARNSSAGPASTDVGSAALSAKVLASEPLSSEALLRESIAQAARYESRFSAIFDSTPFGIRLYHLEEDGRLVLQAANPAADALWGFSHDRLLGLTIEEAFPGSVGTPLPDSLREVAAHGGQWQTEQYAYQDDHVAGYFEVRAFRTEPNTVAVMFENITKRRTQEIELEEYRATLEEIVAARTKELAKAAAERDAVVEIAVKLVEARDPYTAGHQRRVAELVRAICGRLDLCDVDTADIFIAAQLHDIGKVSVPADILSKPVALTRTEYLLVQEHSETAFHILESASLGPRVAEIVFQHHERMDGSGYPRGLRGDEILMGARIICVADVVEAMASHRPYRASVGLSAALDEIECGSGSIYDSAVVDCCLELFSAGFTFSEVG